MARKNDRRNAGMWFLGILGLILTLIGFRYASSSDWWTSVFGGDRRASQTINTGASVFMPTPSASAPAPTPSSPAPSNTPAGEGLVGGASPNPSAQPSTGPTGKSRRLW